MSLNPPPLSGPPVSGLDQLRSRVKMPGDAGLYAVTVVLGLAVGAVVGRPRLPADMNPLLFLMVVPVILATALFLRHPKWCVVGILAGTLFGTYRSGYSIGPVDIRLTDLPMLMLAGWTIHLRVKEGPKARSTVGQLQLCVLLLVFGVSLSATLAAATGGLADPMLSWLRIVATFGLVWLVPYAVRAPEDRELLFRAFLLLATAELLSAIFLVQRAGGRLTGANGPNVEGLMAVLLLIAVIHLPRMRRGLRVAIGLVAAAALVLSASIASVTALTLVLGIYGVRAAGERDRRADAVMRPARAFLLVVGAVLLVGSLRPHDLPSAEGFNNSSAAVRLSLGYAGLEVFAQHPIMGVGWQRSSLAEVIGSQELVDRVRRRFPNIRDDLLVAGDSVTVHNAYVQVLAETGLVGFSVLILALVAGRRGARAVLLSAGKHAELVRTLTISLVVILIWWNDNPLFGAQPEVILFATFLGLLASFPPPAPRFADDRPVRSEARAVS